MAYRRTTEIVLEQPFAGSTITVIDRDGISTRSLTEITNAYSGRRFRFIDPSPFTPKPTKPTDSQNADNSVPQPARAETELECRNVLTILREIGPGAGTTNADEALAEVAQTWPKLATLVTSETIDRPGVEKVVRYSSNNSKLAEVYLEKFDGLWNVTLLRICDGDRYCCYQPGLLARQTSDQSDFRNFMTDRGLEGTSAGNYFPHCCEFDADQISHLPSHNARLSADNLCDYGLMVSGRRRGWCVVVLLVGLVATIVAGVVLRDARRAHWRPALVEGERYGIDVSAHQGLIDWPAVAADGIEFVYLKASEGGDLVDAEFARNWEQAAAAGLDRGAYHFFTLCRSGADQARNFLASAPPEAGVLAPAVDLELSGNCSQRPPAETVRAELGIFVNQVEAAWGRAVVLYLIEDFARTYTVDQPRPRWQRRLFHRPADDDWLIWQLHADAAVQGVRGGVDLNMMRER